MIRKRRLAGVLTFALAVTLIITVKLIKWADRWSTY